MANFISNREAFAKIEHVTFNFHQGFSEDDKLLRQTLALFCLEDACQVRR